MRRHRRVPWSAATVNMSAKLKRYILLPAEGISTLEDLKTVFAVLAVGRAPSRNGRSTKTWLHVSLHWPLAACY